MCQLLILVALLWSGLGASPEVAEHVVAAGDQLKIVVWNQPQLSGQFEVDPHGAIEFPLLGRVEVVAQTLRGVEDQLTKLLSDGYLRRPQVKAELLNARTVRVFVMGEVRSPGNYQLAGAMTILEAIGQAGSLTAQAAGHALIIRPKAGEAGPATTPDPDTKDENVRTVSLQALQNGDLTDNVRLQDGDTLYVPRAASVYVYGYVRTPGAYVIETGTTVLQALSLAGGVSERGSTGRIRILRVVDDTKQEIKVKLGDPVKPGDTIVVGRRMF
jgi:polysaccharide biosynthesis/export protein